MLSNVLDHAEQYATRPNAHHFAAAGAIGAFSMAAIVPTLMAVKNGTPAATVVIGPGGAGAAGASMATGTLRDDRVGVCELKERDNANP